MSIGPGGLPPLGRGILRLALAVAVGYVGLGLGLSYWQVIQASALTRDPRDPLVIAAREQAVRGRILDARGTVLAVSRRTGNGPAVRSYPQPAAAPFVGYASPRFGSAGLEAAYDAELSGAVPASGLDELLRKLRPPTPEPADVVTSVDERLQARAMALLGDQRGAIVALDPATGRVLALASSPTFDPNRIVDPSGGAAYLGSLTAQGADASPLLDRATQGRYVPGSVFKIVTAVAGLGSGAIGPDTTFADQPADERSGFLVDGFRVVDGHHAFTGSTALDFEQAVEVSCNIWFAHAGLAIGPDALRDWARRLGFEAPIPFDLPTAVSQVTNGSGPDGGFVDQVELANAAYGQGQTLVTPLQMALVAATIANGGLLMRPELVTEIRPASGAPRVIQPEVLRRVLDAKTAGLIRDAMEGAVESDWGARFAGAAKVEGVPTAGKSGTAQLAAGEPHSWFIGFAPVDHPRIAVAVLVERGGHGADSAVPLAGRLMTYALGLSH